MKYKKLISKTLVVFVLLSTMSIFHTAHAQVTTDDIPLTQSDIDASTLTVYPNPLSDDLHYIQDVISGKGNYFYNKNSFLRCNDASGNSMVCYCAEPFRPAPTTNTSYSDYYIIDMSTEDGIRQAKTLPMLVYGYSANESSCNSYLHNAEENAQHGGTFGYYVINGEIKKGLLINGVFFEMSANEAYALTAALIHKTNGAYIEEITGSNKSNSNNVKEAAKYFETISNWTYQKGIEHQSLWFAADALNSCCGHQNSFDTKILHPSQGWIPLPDISTPEALSEFSINDEIKIKIIYQSSYMENKLIPAIKAGMQGHINYNHESSTYASFNFEKTGYYDYFKITEGSDNTINLNIYYSSLTNDSFTPENISSDYQGTKFCQEATITFSFDEIKSGKTFDICFSTDTGASMTPAYGDGEKDGVSNFGMRYFQAPYYQNIVASSPNNIVNPLSSNLKIQLNPTLPIETILIKQDETGTPLANGEFTVKYYSAISDVNPASSGLSPDKTWTIKTDSNGVAKLNPDYLLYGDSFFYDSSNNICLPLGTITIEETTAPNGYYKDDIFIEKRFEPTTDVYTIPLSFDNIYQEFSPPVFINSEIKQPFQIIKTGTTANDEEIPLSGAGFMACPIKELEIDNNGNYVWDETKCIPLTPDGDKELFTDEDGHAKSIPLSYGTYLIKETTVPFNYLPVDDFLIDITADSYEPLSPIYVTDIMHTSSVTGQICIYKTGETQTWDPNTSDFITDYIPLENIQFDIFSKDNIYVCSIYTNKDGYAETSDLLPLGSYYIREHTPAGYQEASDIEIELTEKDELIEIKEESYLRYVSQYKLNIENQLIIPAISSYALDDVSKTQYCEISTSCSVTDTILFENLIVGEEYTLKGTLINKETGEILLQNQTEATSIVSFTPENTSGEIYVPFTFDSSSLDNTDIVIFEELYRGDELVAMHSDINCNEQTLYIRTTPKEEITPSTGDSSNIKYIIILLILTGIALCIFAHKFHFKKTK